MTKSVTLYDHTSEFVQIKQALEDDPDIDGPAIENLLQEISGQIEDKIRGAAAVIDEWALEKEAAEILRKRIQSRERAISNRIDRLKSWLLFNMERGGITQIKAVDHSLRVSIRKPPPHVVIDDEDAIPDSYKSTEVKINKAAIRADLRQNSVTEIPGARLQDGELYITIKT